MNPRRLAILVLLLACGHLSLFDRTNIAPANAQLGAASSDVPMKLLDQVGGTGSALVLQEIDDAAYVGSGPRVVRFEIDPESGELTPVARSEVLPGQVTDLVIEAGFLYAMTRPAALIVLADRGDMLEVVGEMELAHWRMLTAVDGALLLTDWGDLGERAGGVDIVDLSSPTQPVISDRVRFPLRDLPDNQVFNVRTIANEHRAHVFHGDNYGGNFISTITLTEDGRPEVLGTAELDLMNIYDAQAVGDRLALIDSYAASIYDISEPGSLRLLGTAGNVEDFLAQSLAFDGDRLYLSSGIASSGARTGIFQFDASSPVDGLVEIGHVEQQRAPEAMQIVGDRMIALREPEVGSMTIESYRLGDDGDAPDLVAQHWQPGYVEQAVAGKGFALIRGSNDVWMLPEGRAPTRLASATSQNRLVDLHLEDDVLITASDRDGLRWFRFDDGGEPVPLGDLPHQDDGLRGGAIDVLDDHLIQIRSGVASRSEPARAALQVVDVADPSAPEQVATLPIAADSAWIVATEGGAVVLGSELTAYDLGAPDAPRSLGSFPIRGEAVGLQTMGPSRVLAASDAELAVLDVDVNGFEVRSLLVMADEVLFVGATTSRESSFFALIREAGQDRGLQVVRYRLAEDDRIQEVDRVNVPEFTQYSNRLPEGLVLLGDRVLVPAFHNGVYVIGPAQRATLYLPRLILDRP